ncbi:MAG: L-2-hydroxyglutarate oxidase [Cytophagales bacterium]|nr:MAG: L-2-hydroxyglutarate oxidase [Cytophagales bacterium]
MRFDVIVIGGGIVGLATAHRLLKQNPSLKLLLLEKEGQVAKHQTGNNSGVIHSGIYYKTGSLKAKNCIRGYQMLLDFCQETNVPFDLCGKIIVATKETELKLLETLYLRGQANGLGGLKRLKKEELRNYEPHVAGIAGVFVPQTGIVDYARVSEALLKSIQEMGAEVRFETKVIDVQMFAHHVSVYSPSQAFEAKLTVNCAGLYSDKIAALTVPDLPLRIVPFRGEYYKLKPEKEYLVKNLIYPVPNPDFPFLGVHFTRMAKGGVEAGPNAVLAYRREGYTKKDIHLTELMETLRWKGFQKVAMRYWETGFGEFYRSYSKSAFTKALQELIPEVQKEDLIDGGAGVRAQACDYKGGLLDDFAILERKGVINVCNAPSPAATSSLSIGQDVSEMVLKQLGYF